jgi:Flp pilus assembly protein TadB
VDDLINYLSAHPVALVVIAAAAFLLVYLILRNMLKLILITGLVVLVLGLIALYGYHHYSGDPERFPESVKEMVDRIGDQRERLIEAGKDVIEKVGESIREKRGASKDE